jgi:small subunit ribosomal protein S1
VADTTTIGKAGDVMKFKIVSIEPAQHRLGLSLKALDEKGAPAAEEKKEEAPAEEAPATETAEEAAPEAEAPAAE